MANSWQQEAWEECQDHNAFMVFTDLHFPDPLPEGLQKSELLFVILYAWLKRGFWKTGDNVTSIYEGWPTTVGFPGDIPLDELVDIGRTKEWVLWKELVNPPPTIEEQPTVTLYLAFPERVASLEWSAARGEGLIEKVEVPRAELRDTVRRVWDLPDSAVSQCATVSAIRNCLANRLKLGQSLYVAGRYLHPNVFETSQEAWDDMIKEADLEVRKAQSSYQQASLQLGLLYGAKHFWKEGDLKL